MCTEKGIAAGVANEDRINRLVEAAIRNGDLDSSTAKVLRNERKQSLDSMDKAALVQICEDLEIDTLVKEVMVERILSHEAEVGEPVPKRRGNRTIEQSVVVALQAQYRRIALPLGV